MNTLKINEHTKILVSASSYNIENDKRLLLPFTSGEKIGFINHQGKIVVEPQYTMYYGDVYNAKDYMRVAIADTYGFAKGNGSVTTYRNSLYGLLDANGEIIFEPIYRHIIPSIKGDDLLFTVQRDGLWGVIDINEKEIIPFGKYAYMDGFDSGYARVYNLKETSGQTFSKKQWGIIDEKGNEVLPTTYDEIWNFYDKSRYSTRVVKDGESQEFHFGKKLSPSKSLHINDSYGSHYGEYAGSYAQDVAGYSDDVINDAFDGDPDAYWNID